MDAWLKLDTGFYEIKIGLSVFSDIVHDESWLENLVTDEATVLQKKLLAQIFAKWAQIGLKTRFFAIFSSLVHYFSFKLHTMIACHNL